MSNVFKKGDVISVQVFAPVDQPFDYLVGEEGLELGSVVLVPFGNQMRRGVVWGKGTRSDRLKPVEKRLDFPAMKPEFRQFVTTMAQYTITPIGQILLMAYRAEEPKTPKPNALRAISGFEGKLTPKQSALFDELKAQDYLYYDDISASRGVMTGLIKAGAAKAVFVEVEASLKPAKPLTLSPAQLDAVGHIKASTKPVLVKGVTGSGKTEVYLEAIADVLDQGQQALILLPEIALTAAFLQRFEARFGMKAGHWHSDMGQAARREIWHGVADGKVKVVIGARSALFLPFQALGMIVVDEEHDRGYKQEEGVIYNGRDMAVLRGSLEGAKLVLASATPSVETMVNARVGRYEYVALTERFGMASLPQMRVVDMREAGLAASEWLSPMLEGAVRERIAQGEQSLLFLNRRGFAPLTLCRACGHQLGCPNCDARLVEHRHRGGLHCHQCGYQMAIPKDCPDCGAQDRLVPIGPGVERLAEEVRDKLPEARICVLSSDIVGGEAALGAELSQIERGDYDVVIGTQMVAKGHNFPALTLVGIVDADIGLEGADLRAAEGSFQILRQVAGRAGRYEKPGLALVQSYQPDHPILRAILSEDDQGFYEEEIARREYAYAPPFSRYIALVIWAGDLGEAMGVGRELLARSGELRAHGVQVFGPVGAPIARIRNRSRVRMLLKMPKAMMLHGLVRDWVRGTKIPAKVKVQIDVDPQSFL